MHKWKKKLSFLMALALLASAAPVTAAMDGFTPLSIQASAVDLDSDTEFLYNDFGSYVEIVGYEGSDKEIEIPSKIDGKPVEVIAPNAFADAQQYGNLTKITLPNSIRRIGKNAFAGCTNVTEGIIPSKFIGICAAAKDIKVSENVTELVSFKVIDNKTTRVSTADGLASLYTEYTIDDVECALAVKDLAVPKAVADADVSELTAESFKSFVQKYSTITDVWVYNRECAIADDLIPDESVDSSAENGKCTIHGYRVSTAHTYATANKRAFKPLDGEASTDDILEELNPTFTWYDSTKKDDYFVVNVDAGAGDYYVYRTGIIIDKKNQVTSATVEDELKLNDSRFIVGKKYNASTGSFGITENGLGAWVRPYVIVDNGSGDESQAVTKYGEPEFIYAEDHIRNRMSVAMETSVSETDDQIMVARVNAGDSIYNNEYVKTGLILDKNGVVKDEADAKEQLVIDTTNSKLKVVGREKAEYSATISDIGNGIWVVGYTTVKLNGNEVTKYTDPVFWTGVKDPFADVTVNTSYEVLNNGKIKLTANAANADNFTVLKSGIIADRTGTVSSIVNADGSTTTAESLLTLESDVNGKQVFTAENDPETVVRMADGGSGIWYVGYAVVTDGNNEKTIYSSAEYAYNEEATKETGVTMTFQNYNGKVFRVDVISRAGEETPVQAGVLLDKNGVIKNADEAKEKMVLGSTALPGMITGKKTSGVITAYAANVTDTGNGAWCVGYLKTDKGVYYTDPVYIKDNTTIAEANVSVKLAYAPSEDKPNNVRVDVTSTSGDSTPKRTGVILNKNGAITNKADAQKYLTLDSDFTSKTIGKKADSSTYAANIADIGSDIWVVGYVVVEINGNDYVKYTEPYCVNAKS